jgi:N-acyl amino acid synthase of PEP-CTERM/exosortase system
VQALYATPGNERLAELFSRTFSVVCADDADLRDALYRLRFQVYCIENAFEDAAQCPDGRETDAYDPHSLHAALIHRYTNEVVGGVRLILPDPATGSELPIRTIVGGAERRFLGQFKGTVAEISRYAVHGAFRRRSGEDYPDVGFGGRAETERRRVMPYLTLGLMRGILGFCAQRNIEALCATMAPPLMRLLDHFGLHFQPIGPLVAFHGIRQPCFARYEDLLRGLRSKSADLVEVVERGFDNDRIPVPPLHLAPTIPFPGALRQQRRNPAAL